MLFELEVGSFDKVGILEVFSKGERLRNVSQVGGTRVSEKSEQCVRYIIGKTTHIS